MPQLLPPEPACSLPYAEGTARNLCHISIKISSRPCQTDETWTLRHRAAAAGSILLFNYGAEIS